MTTVAHSGTGVRRGTRDAITVLAGTWLVLGLFLDGYMHNTRGDQLESFATPWHAVLYSGFLVSAGWIAWPALARDGHWRERLDALPAGYGLGVLGAVIFGIGGAADAVWHSLLGIEVDLEALLSPPHLTLFAGAMLILTTPARAAWSRSEPAGTLRAFLPTLGSVILAMLLTGFFFMYSSGLYDFHATSNFVTVANTQLASTPFLYEILSGFGVVSRLFVTALLMLPVLLLLRRWTVPSGSFTLLFASYGAFMLVLEDFRMPVMALVALATGVAADGLYARLRPGRDRPGATYVFAAVVPMVLWSLHFAALAAQSNLGWPFALWGGVVLFAGGVGLALTLLAMPPGEGSPDRGELTGTG